MRGMRIARRDHCDEQDQIGGDLRFTAIVSASVTIVACSVLANAPSHDYPMTIPVTIPVTSTPYIHQCQRDIEILRRLRCK